MRRLLPLLLLAACVSETESTEVFRTKNPFSTPEDRLTGQAEACATHQEERCHEGTLQTCGLFDTNTGGFVTPDPLTKRALLYERRYEHYHAPDGIHAKRQFVGPTPATMSEAEWGALDHFAEFNGMGDSAIWTGVALNAKILRYLVTGTEVDYARMEQQVRQLLMLFEVTGIPGHLARYHYYRVPDGTPQDDRHAIFSDARPLQHTDYPIEDVASLDGLPDLYRDGTGAAYWHGTPTIDQYSGLTTSLPAAWGLLRDEGLKSKIALHLGCYLKRLRRLEVINIRKNLEAKELISAFFEQTGAQLDEDDIDLTELDTIVMYYLPQPNSLNADTFDNSCPDTIALTPEKVIDATDGDFFSQMLDPVADINGAKKTERATNKDHYYLPNARGADAVHLMGLAAMNYHFTGDPIFKEFLEVELVQNLQAIEVAKTYSAVIPPKWCRKWYASHISIGPLWGINQLLDQSPLLTDMQTVMRDEAWLKDGAHLANAKFALMAGGTVGLTDAAQEGVAVLSGFGGNGGDLDDPRRTYDLPYDRVAAELESHGITAECPSEAVVRFCEEGQMAFGIALNPFDITEPCTGAANECPAYNGECAEKRASSPLPVHLREMWGFQWQGDPFRLGQPVDAAIDGLVQSSGIDLIESYWLARHYGFLPEAEGQVLAWEDTGTCN